MLHRKYFTGLAVFPRSVLTSLGLVLCTLALSGPAHAVLPAGGSNSDRLVEGALQCTQHFPRFEREMGIPTHLLSAIASTESGRYHDTLKIKLPWPWTVGASGKGQYFGSKAEAVAAVKRMKAQGIKNIDVGCMQVNLYHHGDAFDSIEQAFEPQYNIAYAANFLRRLYDDNHSWKQAASDYHSKTPALGTKYISRVYDSWYGIIQKLREARVAVPNSSVSAMNEMKSGAKTYSTAKVEPIPSSTPPSAKVYTAPHMKSIKVTKVEEAPAAEALTYTRRPVDKSAIVMNIEQPAAPARAPSQAVVVKKGAPSAPQPELAGASALPAISPAAGSVPAAPNVQASVGSAPANSQSSAPAQASAQVSVAVNAPLDGVAQAAALPVQDAANALLKETTQMAYNMPPEAPTATTIHTPEPVVVDYAARRILESQVETRSGPRFIFSE